MNGKVWQDMQSTVYKSSEDDYKLREFSVSSISREFQQYTSRIPRFQEFARNSRDRFGSRKLFTDKTVNYPCGASALMMVSEYSGKAKLVSMERCHNRFCPLCSYVEQKKDSLRVRHILTSAFEEEDSCLIAFTLSFPNCSGAELNDEIKALNKAFKRFSNECFPDAVKDNIKIGTFRKLEVTLSEKFHKKMLDEGVEDYMNYPSLFNPHLHVLFHIRKSAYFGTEYYKIPQQYLDVWRRVSGRYDTVNQYIKAYDPSKKDLANGLIRDYSFYVAKPNDLLFNQEVFDIMVSAIKGKQGYSLGGTLEQYALAYDRGDYSVKRKLSQNGESDNISTVYTHISCVRFCFDDDTGYYYCDSVSKLDRPVIASDSDFIKVFRCSHLLSYDFFLSPLLQDFIFGRITVEEVRADSFARLIKNRYSTVDRRSGVS